jgi:MFS family permease
MVGMSVLRTLGRTAVLAVFATRRLAGTGVRTTRFVARNVVAARRRGGAGESGMMRLLDLHAASCAGDTLVAVALAGTVFFSVPVGEARGRVALYLLVTMLPFALLAPVVGPVLDRFRHGRRYALAVTMLGRAFLAYMISEHIGGYTLYPAAFGMLVLSRAYGVARSAAVPRLLPANLGLSEAGARASLFGTVAGAVIVPIGVGAALFGPALPLRLSMIVFVFGMVVALRLPPRADSQPPEVLPRAFQLPGRKGAKVLSGRLVLASLAGSASLRAVYGFLTLFLAFTIRTDGLPTGLPGWSVSATTAIAMVVGALGLGSFLATAVGTTLRIRRPATLQAGAILAVTLAGVAAVATYNLLVVTALCLVTAVASGLAKLAIDAVIQERIPERVRASAFAHSETLLMVAWVAGGALGLIPFAGRLGAGVLAAFLALALGRAVLAAGRLRRERLHGAPSSPDEPATVDLGASGGTPDSGNPRGPTGTEVPRGPKATPGPGAEAGPAPAPSPGTTRVLVQSEPDPPAGYHLYRPSGTDPTLDLKDDS